MKLAAVAAFIAACPSCATFKPGILVNQEYETPGFQRMVMTAVRIRVYCNGELFAYGSGVAVSPRHVLSAKHIARACQSSGTPDMGEFTAVFADGSTWRMAVDKEAASDEVDAARFLNLEGLDFRHYASLAGYQPRVFQPVYMYTSDGTMDNPGEHAFQAKDGRVSYVTGSLVVVSIHGVPGNSGGAVFDDRGRVLGILWGGRWSASQENYIEAYRPDSWPELMPPVYVDMN